MTATRDDERAPHSQLETEAADDEAVICDYCGRPFAREELLVLHHGQHHSEALTESERDAFEEVFDDEQERIRLFRLKALGALVILYFGFLMVYAVV